MTLTIELPEETRAQLATLPRDARAHFMMEAFSGSLSETFSEAIAEALYVAELEANFDPERDAAECHVGVEEGIADFEAGRSMSLENVMQRWNITPEDLRNAPEGIINGQAK